MTKKCPVCKTGKILKRCDVCGRAFQGKPKGCKNYPKKCPVAAFTHYNWSCGHQTPYR